MRKKRIALFGATGAVGGYFLNKALSDGHDVVALVRSPDKVITHENLYLIKGDVSNPDDVAKTVATADVVVSCLGNVNKNLIMDKAAKSILSAAARESVLPRCMFISTIGCGGTSWLIKMILTMIGGRAGMADYERADARITSERIVPYMLVRPGALREIPGNGKYRVFKGGGTFARPIAKQDVAQFLFDAISDTQWDGDRGVQLAGAK